MEHHRVHKSAAVMSGSRMNDHSLWFVDDQDILVLIQDVKRDILRLNIGDLRFWQDDLNLIVGSDLII